MSRPEEQPAPVGPDPEAGAGPVSGSGEGDLLGRIASFLAGHTTLSLATIGDDGEPAVAAIFYAHDAALNLFFLSELRTAHGRNLAARPIVAGAIQDDGQDWRTIRGLQLRGRAEPVAATGLPHAMAVYGRKYLFLASLFAGADGPGILRGPLARARFYVLRPAWLRLVDNTVSFGHKEELILDRSGA
jgi:uncharacterized protein